MTVKTTVALLLLFWSLATAFIPVSNRNVAANREAVLLYSIINNKGGIGYNNSSKYSDNENEDEYDDATIIDSGKDMEIIGTSFPSSNEEDLSTTISTSTSTGISSSSNSSNKGSLFQRIDQTGQSFKTRAAKASSNASSASKQGARVKLVIKSCLFYTLFLFYRAYRGFFVIIPAVFRDVYNRLSNALYDPFDSDDSEKTVSKVAKWRTRITIAVLSTVVMAVYIITGAVQVIFKLFSTLFSTTSPTTSFAAAVEEQEENEAKITKRISRLDTNRRAGSGVTGSPFNDGTPFSTNSMSDTPGYKPQ